MTTATPEEARTQIVNMVREFVRRDLEPVAAELDREDKVPHDLIDKMKDLGLFGITVPEEYGGLGLDYKTFASIFEELSKGFMSITGAIGTHHILTYVLMHYGTEEQKQRFLPDLASGRKRGGLRSPSSEATQVVSVGHAARITACLIRPPYSMSGVIPSLFLVPISRATV